jgi:hypothetical protein
MKQVGTEDASVPYFDYFSIVPLKPHEGADDVSTLMTALRKFRSQLLLAAFF